MKGKKFYLILIGLIAVGIGSTFIYKQQQEARALEFEGYEISAIENRVNSLYNDNKTDIQEDISVELEDLEPILLELKEKDLSYRSKTRIENMREDFYIAKEMHELQKEISDLFKEETIVRTHTSLDDIEDLKNSLGKFENKTVYYERNKNYIADARVQIETIEEVTELVEKLSSDDLSAEDIDEEELEKIEELINQIKDEDIKEQLTKQLETVRLALTEAEEEVALDEVEETETELDEIEEVELIEQETVEDESTETVQETNTTVEQPNTPPAQNNNQSQTTNNQAQSTSRNTTSSSQSNTQTQKPSTPTQKPPAPSRPAVAKKYQETSVEEIPYTTTVNESSNLTEGTEVVFSEGSPGTRTVTYEITVYNNGTSNKKIVSESIQEPTTRVITVGTKPSSTVEEPPTDEN